MEKIVNWMGICLKSEDDNTIDIYFHGLMGVGYERSHGSPWKPTHGMGINGWARCNYGVSLRESSERSPVGEEKRGFGKRRDGDCG